MGVKNLCNNFKMVCWWAITLKVPKSSSNFQFWGSELYTLFFPKTSIIIQKKKTLYSIADLGPALSIPRYMDIGQAGATLLYFSYFLKSELELPC